MKKCMISITLSGLFYITACSPASVQPTTDVIATKMAGDFYATETAFANQTYLQEMANATATKMAQDIYATQTESAYEATATSLSQLTAQAVVNIGSMNVRSGPGTSYPVQGYVVKGDKLIILGQAYDCAWLKVETPDGQTGWVSTTYVTYSLACGEITQAPIPLAPTQVAQAQPTSSCGSSDAIDITNDTGGTVTLYLSGPASYTFHLSTGDTTISVCPGTYSYTAYGCGGASKTGTITSGESHRFFCS